MSTWREWYWIICLEGLLGVSDSLSSQQSTMWLNLWYVSRVWCAEWRSTTTRRCVTFGAKSLRPRLHCATSVFCAVLSSVYKSVQYTQPRVAALYGRPTPTDRRPSTCSYIGAFVLMLFLQWRGLQFWQKCGQWEIQSQHPTGPSRIISSLWVRQHFGKVEPVFILSSCTIYLLVLGF